jgi:hypothetical protein
MQHGLMPRLLSALNTFNLLPLRSQPGGLQIDCGPIIAKRMLPLLHGPKQLLLDGIKVGIARLLDHRQVNPGPELSLGTGGSDQ